MLYSAALIDVANFFYRLKGKLNKVSDVVNVMIDHTNEAKNHMSKGGKLYLLYDPLPMSDLGVSKVFKYDHSRKAENSSYKAGRKYSPLYQSVICSYKKYYTYRGEDVISVYSDAFEADDYVESVIKAVKAEKPTANIAMLSTDHDWSRYISAEGGRIDQITADWGHPYTRDDFYKDYDFYPSPSAMTLYLAVFGDDSDNIKGAIKIKKSLELIRNPANDAIKYLGEHDMAIDDLAAEFKNNVSIDIMQNLSETPLKFLIANIVSMDMNNTVNEQILANIDLIKSRCVSYKKYAHSHDINKTFNEIMDKSLDRAKKLGGIEI